MNHIIRDIELCKLVGETPVGETKHLIDFFDNIFDKMVFKTHDNYPESTFMCVGDKMFFRQDLKHDRLWCRYKEFWSILEREFKYSYTDTQTIIKYMVEECLKSRIGVPSRLGGAVLYEIEESLKPTVGIPVEFVRNDLWMIEEDIKPSIGIPILVTSNHFIPVEESLKLRVGTPFKTPLISTRMVEEGLKPI